MSEPGAEKMLEALRRQAANLECCNCSAVSKGGHGAVVMSASGAPLGIFVCHTCKSASQSFSFLCKSVTMSYWTKAEVAKVKNGGNARVRAQWHAKLDTAQRPSPGLSLVAAKDFVNACYNDKKWYDPEATFVASSKKETTAPPKASSQPRALPKPSSSGQKNGHQNGHQNGGLKPNGLKPRPISRPLAVAPPPASRQQEPAPKQQTVAAAAAPRRRERPAAAAKAEEPPAPPALDLLSFDDVDNNLSTDDSHKRAPEEQQPSFFDAFAAAADDDKAPPPPQQQQTKAPSTHPSLDLFAGLNQKPPQNVRVQSAPSMAPFMAMPPPSQQPALMGAPLMGAPVMGMRATSAGALQAMQQPPMQQPAMQQPMYSPAMMHQPQQYANLYQQNYANNFYSQAPAPFGLAPNPMAATNGMGPGIAMRMPATNAANPGAAISGMDTWGRRF